MMKKFTDSGDLSLSPPSLSLSLSLSLPLSLPPSLSLSLPLSLPLSLWFTESKECLKNVQQ